MIGRILGVVTALVVTLIAVAGIVLLIAIDMVSGDVLLKAWQSVRASHNAQAERTDLADARDFSFFKSEKVAGHDFSVTTGERFATLADMTAGRQQNRWCYVLIHPKGGVPRQIELARQSGTGPPIFTDLSAYPEAELRALGVSAAELAAIARKHCRTCCPDGRLA